MHLTLSLSTHPYSQMRLVTFLFLTKSEREGAKGDWRARDTFLATVDSPSPARLRDRGIY